MRSSPSLPTVASQVWCGESCRKAGLSKWPPASFSRIRWTASCALEGFSPCCMSHEKQLGALPKTQNKTVIRLWVLSILIPPQGYGNFARLFSVGSNQISCLWPGHKSREREGSHIGSCAGHLYTDGHRHPHNLTSLEVAQHYEKESWNFGIICPPIF